MEAVHALAREGAVLKDGHAALGVGIANAVVRALKAQVLEGGVLAEVAAKAGGNRVTADDGVTRANNGDAILACHSRKREIAAREQDLAARGRIRDGFLQACIVIDEKDGRAVHGDGRAERISLLQANEGAVLLVDDRIVHGDRCGSERGIHLNGGRPFPAACVGLSVGGEAAALNRHVADLGVTLLVDEDRLAVCTDEIAVLKEDGVAAVGPDIVPGEHKGATAEGNAVGIERDAVVDRAIGIGDLGGVLVTNIVLVDALDGDLFKMQGRAAHVLRARAIDHRAVAVAAEGETSVLQIGKRVIAVAQPDHVAVLRNRHSVLKAFVVGVADPGHALGVALNGLHRDHHGRALVLILVPCLLGKLNGNGKSDLLTDRKIGPGRGIGNGVGIALPCPTDKTAGKTAKHRHLDAVGGGNVAVVFDHDVEGYLVTGGHLVKHQCLLAGEFGRSAVCKAACDGGLLTHRVGAKPGKRGLHVHLSRGNGHVGLGRVGKEGEGRSGDQARAERDHQKRGKKYSLFHS